MLEERKLNREVLLEAGVHCGHLSKRWSPDFKPFLFMKRLGRHVINLDKTIQCLKIAGDEMKALAQNGKKILFVGRKRQIKEIVESFAQKAKQPYIVERWLGGTLTNFITIKKLFMNLSRMEQRKETPEYINLTKKEKLIVDRKKKKIEILLEGMMDLKRLPSAIFAVDVNKERTAIEEAHKLGIPVFAIVDSNASPRFVDYPIPGNDDSCSSVQLILSYLADEIQEGNRIWHEEKEKQRSKKGGAMVAATKEGVEKKGNKPALVSEKPLAASEEPVDISTPPKK